MTHRRGGGPKALAAMLPKIAGRALGRRGFAEAAIVTDWWAIVGERMAVETVPRKLSFRRGEKSDGTLHLCVNGAFATELQHLAPQMIERINGYFGYAAVARLALIQGHVPPYRRKGRQRIIAREAEAPPGLAERLADIEDEDLRSALARLGATLRQATR